MRARFQRLSRQDMRRLAGMLGERTPRLVQVDLEQPVAAAHPAAGTGAMARPPQSLRASSPEMGEQKRVAPAGSSETQAALATSSPSMKGEHRKAAIALTEFDRQVLKHFKNRLKYRQIANRLACDANLVADSLRKQGLL